MLNIPCFTMDFKENTEKKSIILKHEGLVSTIIFKSDHLVLNLKKDNKHFLEIYDFKNFLLQSKKYPKKTITTHPLSDHFISNKKLFLIASKLHEYKYIALNNYLETIDGFNNEIDDYIKSLDKRFLLFSLKNGCYLHNIASNTSKKISSEKIINKKFNPNSTYLTFFDPSATKLIIYDLEKCKIFKERDCEKNVADLFFPHNTVILFSYDRQNYSLWEIYTDNISDIKLDDKHYEYDVSNKTPRYFHFQIPFKCQCTIYDLKKHELFNVFQKSPGGSFVCNEKGTYALYATTDCLAIIYETTNWEPIKCICFEEGHLNPFIAFSPCGNYAIAVGRNKNGYSGELKIYDIKNDILLLATLCLPELTEKIFQFYQTNSIIYAYNETTIVIYNYISNKKSVIKSDNNIVCFKEYKGILALSSETQTELIDLKNIEYEECEKTQESIYKEPTEELCVNNQLIDNFSIYDKKGNSIEINKESESYCSIA